MPATADRQTAPLAAYSCKTNIHRVGSGKPRSIRLIENVGVVKLMRHCMSGGSGASPPRTRMISTILRIAISSRSSQNNRIAAMMSKDRSTGDILTDMGCATPGNTHAIVAHHQWMWRIHITASPP